ncbi:unnamed protein product [Didymodactylos carnosus]|uniref:non-specific protein-tyrosine kinase n=1 Tax=Didymodactylos carnosus TaxID=1234261 RepID=A0A813PWD3_9BILA|nr:unnamed protein product [Didymodactylos carnosus]CAF1051502.1 unnamed protein product [Didymodactylos carnosus]CAF3539448.1 unnamed protein product [Didymodactylos carnosus]CAF3818219.1 unnamed protein product [Didymodactylos carnosus]
MEAFMAYVTRQRRPFEYELIQIVLKGPRLSQYDVFYRLSFALRISFVEKTVINKAASPIVKLTTSTSPSVKTIDEKWLHPDMTMDKIQKTYGSVSELKFELRLRYFPQPIEAIIHDKATFAYFYEQLRIDYLRTKSDHGTTNDAIELGCLEIRKLFKDLNPTALDKKINIDYLEKEIGLRKFFPESVLNSYKPRLFRKCIKTCLKKYEGLSEEECMKRFCFLLKDVWNYEQESFTCNLGAEWTVPIYLIIGPNDGISYRTQNSTKSTKMTLFENILAILTTKSTGDNRGLMKLTIAGSAEALTFTFPSLLDANDVAILIDGYCMLINSKTISIWRSVDNESNTSRSCVSPPPFLAPHPLLPITSSDHLSNKNNNSNNQSSSSFIGQHHSFLQEDEDDELNGDYAAILAPSYQIDRKQIQMIEALGHGQFGEVYRGILKTEQQIELNIAIKTCKEQDSLTTEKFLEEAYVMQKFDHPHIIKLIGVCTTHPVLLIMELARLGELRSYLVANRNDFDVITLLVYCQQLSSSLSYLETKKFVHRDIAARNVLVSNHECVKLSDFGLSREIDNSYYKASKGKLLPVKWMSPESSVFLQMAVILIVNVLYCFSEGIPNSDVIDKIENGERLPMPSPHCPPQLFDLMKECWRYEPSMRPSFTQIEDRLRFILKTERSNDNSSVQFKDRILQSWSADFLILQHPPSLDTSVVPISSSSSSSILLTPTTASESLSISRSQSPSFHSASSPSNDSCPPKPSRILKKDHLLLNNKNSHPFNTSDTLQLAALFSSNNNSGSKNDNDLHSRSINNSFGNLSSLRRYQTMNSRTGNSYLKQINKETASRSYIAENLIDLFHSQTKQIISTVLTLTRQGDSDETHDKQQLQATKVYDDKEQMMLVKNIAIAVRDLLQTLDYAPREVKEMSEQRYNHFSNLVVSLIESVRQREYQKMTDFAVDIAKTAKKLFDDILCVLKLIKLSSAE